MKFNTGDKVRALSVDPNLNTYGRQDGYCAQIIDNHEIGIVTNCDVFEDFIQVLFPTCEKICRRCICPNGCCYWSPDYLCHTKNRMNRNGANSVISEGG